MSSTSTSSAKENTARQKLYDVSTSLKNVTGLLRPALDEWETEKVKERPSGPVGQ
jgi:hypothetical protein